MKLSCSIDWERMYKESHKENKRLEQQLSDLKSSLPKVRADAVREAAETCGEYIGGEEACGYYSDLLEHADKLEAGNE